jgi:hypothetical protein
MSSDKYSSAYFWTYNNLKCPSLHLLLQYKTNCHDSLGKRYYCILLDAKYTKASDKQTYTAGEHTTDVFWYEIITFRSSARCHVTDSGRKTTIQLTLHTMVSLGITWTREDHLAEMFFIFTDLCLINRAVSMLFVPTGTFWISRPLGLSKELNVDICLKPDWSWNWIQWCH